MAKQLRKSQKSAARSVKLRGREEGNLASEPARLFAPSDGDVSLPTAALADVVAGAQLQRGVGGRSAVAQPVRRGLELK